MLGQLNLNHLRIFESVYRLKSMTLAAADLHLTQSGVSQHIKGFEDALGFRLFDRVQQRLVPTRQATRLFEEASRTLGGLENVLVRMRQEATGKEAELAGDLTLGMPVEFGAGIVMPLLAEWGRKHPGLRFSLRLGFASRMNDVLLSGEMDFAFVDEFKMDPRIQTETVYHEVLELCVSADYLKTLERSPEHSREFYESLEFVDYQKDEPILRRWFKHHLPGKSPRLKTRATVFDVQGVTRLIQGGLGAGILPGYLLSKVNRESSQKLVVLKGSEKPLKNAIELAYVVGRTHSRAARESLAFFQKRLKLTR